MDHLYHNAELDAISTAFDALVDYTHYHFTEEEKLLTLYDYPGTDAQHKSHEYLIQQVIEYKHQTLSGEIPNRAEFLDCMERWLVRHVLDEDRKYGTFLNAKGVY